MKIKFGFLVAFIVIIALSCKKKANSPPEEEQETNQIQDIWTARTNLPGPKGRQLDYANPGYCTIGNIAYMAYGNWDEGSTTTPCGTNQDDLGCGEKAKIWSYSPSTNVWGYETQIPDSSKFVIGIGVVHSLLNQMFSSGNLIYCLTSLYNGNNVSYFVRVYNTQTKLWSLVGSNVNFYGIYLDQYSGITALPIYYNNNVYCLSEDRTQKKRLLYKFNFSTNLYELINSSFTGYNSQNGSFATFVIGDKLYTAGGAINTGASSYGLWEYNFTSEAWTQKSNFAFASREGAVAFTLNGKGYVGLGTNTNNGINRTALKDFHEFDPITNNWSNKKDFPSTARYSSFCVVLDNKVYIGGGENANNQVYQDMYEYK